MAFRKKKYSKTLKNGSGDTFNVFSKADDPRSDKWWADTSFLVHALSEGDYSTLRGAFEIMSDDKYPVLITGLESVNNELNNRLERLGYMKRDEETVPEELRHISQAHMITDYGAKHIPDFVMAQKVQMEELKGQREPLEHFCKKFAELREHHSGFPLEALHTFRIFFSDPNNDFEADRSSGNLFEIYELLGIVTFSDDGLVRPTRFGSMNVPFLFDLILLEQGGTTHH